MAPRAWGDSRTRGSAYGSPGAGRWQKAEADLVPGIRHLPGDRNRTRQDQDNDLQVGLVGRVHGQTGLGCGKVEISPAVALPGQELIALGLREGPEAWCLMLPCKT